MRAQTRDFIANHGGSNVVAWTFNVSDPFEFCTALRNKSIKAGGIRNSKLRKWLGFSKFLLPSEIN